MEICVVGLCLVAAVGAVAWISPPMLTWVASVALVRKEALRTQKIAKAWFLARFGED